MDKVGIVVECGPEGMEVIFCRRICSLLRQHLGLEFREEIVPLDHKKRLLEDCAAACRCCWTVVATAW